MLKNGQIVKGSIQYIDEAGNGVMMVSKDRVLVRNVLVQESLSVIIEKRIQKGYIGKVKQLINASKERTKPLCSIYDQCGSCHLMHLQQDAQVSYKKKQLQGLCKRVANMKFHINDVISMKEPFHYRNKIIVGFQKDKQRNIQVGFYEEFSHKIIPYTSCLLHPKVCDDIIQSILVLAKKFRIDVYEEDKRRGLLRHVLIRYGEVSKQIMVVLVLQSNVFPARKNFVQALREKHPEITTIIQNVNSRKTSVVLGNEERVLFGQGYIEDTLCDLRFRISAKSFYQINHEQTEILYKTAVSLLQCKGHEKVIDAYCGIGTIGMYVSSFVKEVVGVEVNKDAIEDAKRNAQLNNIKNIHFLCDDAGAYMCTLASKKERVDIVIMDPPRSGSSEEFIQSIARLQVANVLYISCNPETQLRDLTTFMRLGYHVEGDMIPVDMFPFTNHVETIVLLQRRAM